MRILAAPVTVLLLCFSVLLLVITDVRAAEVVIDFDNFNSPAPSDPWSVEVIESVYRGIVINEPGDYVFKGNAKQLYIIRVFVSAAVPGAPVNITFDNVYIESGTSGYSPFDIDAAEVTLLLIGVNELKASGNFCAGIRAANGSILTINAETGAELTATGGTNGAGIGGAKDGESAGYISINGGNITASGNTTVGAHGAGIGGAGGFPGGNGGVITINGGVITAKGARRGAGIGGGGSSSGNGGNGGDITINGGTVTATGGSQYGAGIGGGGSNSSGNAQKGGNGGNITITGGIISAKALSADAPGIGGGNTGGCPSGDGGNISIGSGAYLITEGGFGGLGIGSGDATFGTGTSLLIGICEIIDNSSVESDIAGIYNCVNIINGNVTGISDNSPYAAVDIARAGARVTITALPPEDGYVFDKWKAAEGITLDNESAVSAAFIMLEKTAEVEALYKEAPGSNDTGGAADNPADKGSADNSADELPGDAKTNDKETSNDKTPDINNGKNDVQQNHNAPPAYEQNPEQNGSDGTVEYSGVWDETTKPVMSKKVLKSFAQKLQTQHICLKNAFGRVIFAVYGEKLTNSIENIMSLNTQLSLSLH